jgi:hypothetical protein
MTCALFSKLRFRAGRPGARSQASEPVDENDGQYLDTLALRDAVLGDEIVLEEPREHEFVIHEVVACRARELGRFVGAASAWSAIDQLDDELSGYQPRVAAAPAASHASPVANRASAAAGRASAS